MLEPLVQQNSVDSFCSTAIRFNKYPNIECHIAGDGPLLEDYKKYGHMNNIKFLGHVDKKNVASILEHF